MPELKQTSETSVNMVDNPKPLKPTVTTSPPHKTKSLLWLVGGIIFVLFLVEAYYLGTQRSEIQPAPIPDSPAVNRVPADLTANWETYTNTMYDFSLKYPPDWEVINASGPGNILFQLYKAGPKASKYEFIDAATFKINKTDKLLSESPETLGYQEKFEYEGWKGFRGKPKGFINEKYDYIIATKTFGDKILLIEWEHDDFSNNGLSAEKYLFPILSTFKFLDISPSPTQSHTKPIDLGPLLDCGGYASHNCECAGDDTCPSGFFCDYGYSCTEAPESSTTCTKIYSGSKRCIKKCATNNDCFANTTCQKYYIPSGSDVFVGQLGCKN